MDTANTLSALVIAAGWLAALIWSVRSAWRSAGWRQITHCLNAVLMLGVALSVVSALPAPAVAGAALLLVTTLLVSRGAPTDRWRWLVMVQFVFALLVASGVPFRHG